MKRTFRSLSLALILLLLISMLQVGAFAQETGEQQPQEVLTQEEPASSEEKPAKEEDRIPPGTTPRPEPKRGAVAEISEEALHTSDQIIENFLAISPQFFQWSEDYFVQGWYLFEEDDYIDYTQEMHASLDAKAHEITAKCTTNAQRIRAVAYWMAQNVGYDYDYYFHGTKGYPDIDPYTVLEKRYTVCSGYAYTCEYLLQCLGIPCVYVSAPDHSYNMAYDGSRWVIFDATWMSESTYEQGELNLSDDVYDNWYDNSYENDIRTEENHVIEQLPYSVVDGILTRFPLYPASASFTIPSSVKGIGDSAFGGCISLTSITIPSSVKSMGDSAFEYCWGLASVTIKGGITRIPYRAFYFCQYLTSITIPSSVKTIESEAFNCCGNLPSVTIPSGVTSIGEMAFAYCTELSKAEVPYSVESIGDLAFYGCSDITLKVPSGSYALQYAIDNSLNYTLSIGAPEITSIYKGSSGVTLNWSAVSGATRYRVLRKTTGNYAKLAETTSRTYTDTTAQTGVSYTYSVRAIDSDSVAGSYAAAKKITPLAAPKLSAVYKVSNGVKFLWKASAGAKKYRVMRKTGNGSYVTIAETSALEYIDTTAANGTKYAYTVRAYDANSVMASWYYTGGKVITPLAPVQISSVYKASDGVRVNIKTVSGASKYRIYRKTTGNYEQIGETETAAFTDTTAANGTRYTYAIRAEDVNGTLASWYGTGKAITPLPAPKLGTVSNVSTGIKFTWNSVSGAAKYRVMRKTGSGSYTQIAVTTALSYTDTTAQKGKTYTYTVRAIDEGGVAASWYYTGGKTITKS